MASSERIIGGQGALGTTRGVTIPATAVLAVHGQRSIPTGVIFLRIPPNALVEVKSGRAVVVVRGGMSDG